MKKIVMVLVVSIIIATSQFLSFSFASGKSWDEIEKMGISELIELLNNPDWQERCKAIDGLSKFREKNDEGFPIRFKKEFEGKEEISIALIRLLERENSLSEEWHKEYEKAGHQIGPWAEKYGYEGSGEYSTALVEAVICLYDERAIPALAGASVGGVRLPRALAEFGGLAVNPLLEGLGKTQNSAVKMNIIEALSEIAKKAKLTLQSVEGTPTTKAPSMAPIVSQIELMKEAFIKSLNDSCEFTRMEAIKSLGVFGDTSVIPLLKPIAKNDPCAWNTVSGDPSKFKYPVREEAERVIKLLEEKKKEQESQKKNEEQAK